MNCKVVFKKVVNIRDAKDTEDAVDEAVIKLINEWDTPLEISTIFEITTEGVVKNDKL